MISVFYLGYIGKFLKLCWYGTIPLSPPLLSPTLMQRVKEKLLLLKTTAEAFNAIYTGDFCRAPRCIFCRIFSHIKFQTRSKLRRYRGDEIAGGLHARFWSCNSERDKNCIELHDKNRLCKRAFTKTKICLMSHADSINLRAFFNIGFRKN